jgi:hypothetical protein
MKNDANPMRKAHAALRCHANAKASGSRCKSPAVRGWQVCRMHGAGGGAPTGPANGAWVHGGRSNEVKHIRSMVAECLREAKSLREG